MSRMRSKAAAAWRRIAPSGLFRQFAVPRRKTRATVSAGRYRLEEGRPSLELCIGDMSLAFALEDKHVSKVATHWQLDGSRNTVAFGMPEGTKRLLRAKHPLNLDALVADRETPAFLVFDLLESYPQLDSQCAAVIRVHAESFDTSQSYRISLMRPRPVLVPLPPDFTHINLGIRLAGAGTLAPVKLVMGIPADYAIQEPKTRSDIRERIAKLKTGEGVSWHQHLHPDERDEAVLAMLASQVHVIGSRLQDVAKHLAIVNRQSEELLAAMAPLDKPRLNGFSKVQEALNQGMNAAVLSQMRMARARSQLVALLRNAMGETEAIEVPKYFRVASSPSWREEIVRKAFALAQNEGLFPALTTLWRQVEFVEFKVVLVELAELLSEVDPEKAYQCLILALGLDPKSKKAQFAAAKLFKWGSLTQADSLLSVADAEADTRFISELRLAVHTRETAASLVPERKAFAGGRPVSVAYVASSSQPWSVAGYSIRTHELLTALVRKGVAATCFTRPGFPWDRPDILPNLDIVQSERADVGEVSYVHSKTPFVEENPHAYIANSARALMEKIEAEGCSIVHAASNYRNGLPALIAARSLGLPFIYEVRGLWELTAATRRVGWENTERFGYERQIEQLIVKEADLVFTITDAVREELIGGFGDDEIDPNKFRVLSNAIDPEVFKPVEKDEKLAEKLGMEEGDFILAYAGSLVEYEGLDDVIDAMTLLKDRQLPVKLVIVGDGRMRAELEARARKLVASGDVVFVGRVKPEKISSYLSLADVVPIARKPYRVCDVVSPLKPFEAMAMEKTVVVSDLRALREIVSDGETGRICAPDDAADLARVLQELYADPAGRKRMGKAARKWVVETRSWDQHAKRLEKAYAELVA